MKRPEISVQDPASPYFIRSIARVESVAASHVRKVTTQVYRYRLTIHLRTRLKMKPFKITRGNIIIYQKSKT